jgi:uncharacterized protein YndB with AHSA1/START domain
MTESIRDEIRNAVLVRGLPEACWDALATADGLNAWFTHGAQIDPRSGGNIHWVWKDWGPDLISGQDNGSVLEAERGKHFVFQWHPDDETYTTTVEITFEPSPAGTVVRLREYGYHNTPSGLRAMLDCAAGWGEAMALMKVYVEHGITY